MEIPHAGKTVWKQGRSRFSACHLAVQHLQHTSEVFPADVTQPEPMAAGGVKLVRSRDTAAIHGSKEPALAARRGIEATTISKDYTSRIQPYVVKDLTGLKGPEAVSVLWTSVRVGGSGEISKH